MFVGTRFRKSIKIAPGVRINVGRKSVGMSIGGKYGGMSFNSRTGARARVSAPGTGLSYSTKISGGNRKRTDSSLGTRNTQSDDTRAVKKHGTIRKILGVVFAIIAIRSVIVAFSSSTDFLDIIINAFVKHHKKEYGGNIPMWVAVELFTMGNLHAVYDNLKTPYQKAIAKSFDLSVVLMSSWIESLTYTRNHLAHYMRIYNFNFGRTPKKKKGQFESPVPNMIFDQIQVMAYMYTDKTEWNDYILPEMQSVIDEYKEYVSLSSIGFPENWREVLLSGSEAKADAKNTACSAV